MTLTDASTDLLIAIFVTLFIVATVFVVAELLMRLLAVVLGLFGVDTGD